MGRKYPKRDLEILWAQSAGYCAFPDCRKHLIEEQTEFDAEAITGHIAHIIAHSSSGPRAQPAILNMNLDCYDNWILLCTHHHTIVDKQPNTYKSEDLRSWKECHEEWVKSKLKQEMPNVTFAELEVAVKAIAAKPQPAEIDYTIIPLREKMKKNRLTSKSHHLLNIGFLKVNVVAKFLISMANIDYEFPERLKAGFVEEYKRLYAMGHRGDNLFEELYLFAFCGNSDIKQQAATLAVLTYLFEKCEVFKR